MRLLFPEQGWEDYLWWQAHDARTLARINALIKDASRNPFQGIGKPEALARGMCPGWGTRRITQGRGLVYRAVDGVLQIAQCALSLFEDWACRAPQSGNSGFRRNDGAQGSDDAIHPVHLAPT